MQSVSGTNLVTNAGANYQYIVHRVYFKWDGTNWTDESGYLIDVSVQHDASSAIQGAGTAGDALSAGCDIKLSNANARFCPEYTGGALYSYIGANKGIGTEVKVELGFYDTVNGNEVLRQFTGYVRNPVLAGPRDPVARIQGIGGEFKTFANKTGTVVYENLFVHQYLAILASNAGITSTSFDNGFFRIPYTWCADADDNFREGQRAAGSEMGYLFFDKAGVLTYWNAQHLATGTYQLASVETLDNSDYQAITYRYEDNEAYNSVICPYKPRGPGARAELFALAEEWRVGPGETETFTGTFRHPAKPVETPTANEGYVLVNDDGRYDMSSDCTVTFDFRAQNFDVTVVNSHASYQAVFRKLVILGSPLLGGAVGKVTDEAADSALGDPSAGMVKCLTMQTNDYIQTWDQAAFCAAITKDRKKNPRLIAELTGVPMRPYLEIFDRITVQDSNTGLDRDMLITNLSIHAGAGFALMGLTCTPVSGLFGSDGDDYFRLGVDGLASTNKVFY